MRNLLLLLLLADIPAPQSATLGLHIVTPKLLLILHPNKSRRLSRLANSKSCLQMTRSENQTKAICENAYLNYYKMAIETHFFGEFVS